MKIRVLALITAAFVAFSFNAAAAAVETPQPQGRLEAFTSRSGILINKNLFAVGEKAAYGVIDKKIIFDALVMSEAGKPEGGYRGLRVEITEKKSGEEFGRSAVAFIDMDELEGLSRALAGMMDAAWKWKGEVHGAYRELYYITRGGLEAGVYSKGAEIHAYCSAGRMDARYNVPKTTILFVNVGDFKEIKDIVDRGLALLNEK